MHAYHEGLPGFDPAQILHDGCPECEARGADPANGIGYLDNGNYRRAVTRAIMWETDYAPAISQAEAPLLRMLWTVLLRGTSLEVLVLAPDLMGAMYRGAPMPTPPWL